MQSKEASMSGLLEQDTPIVDRGPDAEDVAAAEPPDAESELVLEDLLVEDVSIDGMCGVY
jgi:mycofactocin precursor